MAGNQTLTLDEFFAGFSESRVLYDHLQRLMNRIGPSESFVSKSQIAFHRKKSFAWIWTPGKYLRGKTAPLVLSLSFHQPDPSSRWKEITDTGNGWFMHHLELYSRLDINAEVAGWLQKAWEQAA